jgi:precorrin-2/cobalt-factor-2 C20-methyltransferase
MRNDNRRGSGLIGKFYGVGLGPGDPKLLTLKAKEILEKVDVIFVPKADREGNSNARSIVEAATAGPWNFVELIFPMTKNEKILSSYWGKAASRITEEVRIGKTVAFVTMGDPFIYSTYIYVLKTLCQNFPDIEAETIPGISAFNAAASLAQIPLVEGKERLAILPVTDDLRPLREALREFDTVVLMKVGSKLERVVRLLDELNLLKNAVLVSHAGCPNEYIERDLSILSGKELGYLSVIIVRCRGGKA